MAEAKRTGRLLALVLVSVVGVAAVFTWIGSDEQGNSVGQNGGAASRSTSTAEVPSRVRSIGDLDNVDRATFALGSIWAVNSALADNFSPGEANAQVVRIDPLTSSVEVAIDGLEVQPTFAALGDVVWAKLDRWVVGFDATGEAVASFPWTVEGDLIAGEDLLWLTDFLGGAATAVDPESAEVVATIETGRFPVSPIVAFGHAWIPSSTDGVVSVIDEATLGGTTNLTIAVPTQSRQTDVTAVSAPSRGDEVWVTNVDGEVFALGAEPATLGDVRAVPVDRSINRIHPAGDRVLMLPTWGRSVLVSDLSTGELLAEIPIDSIPVRAVIAGKEAWISGDGTAELLSRIDVEALTLVEQFVVGENSSTTTGPTQPFVVENEVWIPNRGDDRLFAVTR